MRMSKRHVKVAFELGAAARNVGTLFELLAPRTDRETWAEMTLAFRQSLILNVCALREGGDVQKIISEFPAQGELHFVSTWNEARRSLIRLDRFFPYRTARQSVTVQLKPFVVH